MAETLTDAQLQVLKLLQFETTDEELHELKKIISKYLADRLMRQVEGEIKTKGYTVEQTDSWAKEHFRTPYK